MKLLKKYHKDTIITIVLVTYDENFVKYGERDIEDVQIKYDMKI